MSVSSNPPPRSGGNSRCCCYTFCLGIKAILKVASLTPDREFQYSVRSHHGGVESAPLHCVAFRCLVLADFGRYWRLQRARAFKSNRGTLASLTPDTELITVMSTHITVVMKNAPFFWRRLCLPPFGRSWRLHNARSFRSSRGVLASLTYDTELISHVNSHHGGDEKTHRFFGVASVCLPSADHGACTTPELSDQAEAFWRPSRMTQN